MCKIFQEHKTDIENYCAMNGLDAKKVFSSPKSFNDQFVILQHIETRKEKTGLFDETPAPATLRIFKTDHGVRFEQTNLTQRYLAR